MEATSSNMPESTESQQQLDPTQLENAEDYYDIDFTKELNIPRGVENVDEIEMLTKKYTEQPLSQKENFIRNMYEMICYLSFEDVTSRGQMHKVDQYLLAAKNFETALTSMKQMQWMQERILNHLSPPNEWPNDLFEYLNVRNKLPTKTFIQKNPKVQMYSESDQKEIFFGAKIVTSYNIARHTINTVFNRLWKNPDELESGQTISALCRAIREALWIPDAKKRAKTSWNTRMSRLKKNSSDKEEIANFIANKENDIKEKMNFLLTEYTIDWYPPYWFVFLAFGKPSENIRFPSLQDGTVQSVQPFKDLNIERQISNLEKQITLMKDTNMDLALIHSKQRELFKLLEREQELLTKNETELEGEMIGSTPITHMPAVDIAEAYEINPSGNKDVVDLITSEETIPTQIDVTSTNAFESSGHSSSSMDGGVSASYRSCEHSADSQIVHVAPAYDDEEEEDDDATHEEKKKNVGKSLGGKRKRKGLMKYS